MAFNKLMTAAFSLALACGATAHAASPYDRTASDRVGATVSFVSFPVRHQGQDDLDGGRAAHPRPARWRGPRVRRC